MFDPLELYNGFPYYGFILDPADPAGKRYLLSPYCSEPMPVPEFVVPYIGKDRAPPKKKPSSSGSIGGPAAAAAVGGQPENRGLKREKSKIILTKTGQLAIAPEEEDPVAAPREEEADPFAATVAGAVEPATAVAAKKKPTLTQAERIRLQAERDAGKKPKKLPKLSSSSSPGQAPIKFEAAKTHNQTLKMPSKK